jgi:hypothetical protein
MSSEVETPPTVVTPELVIEAGRSYAHYWVLLFTALKVAQASSLHRAMKQAGMPALRNARFFGVPYWRDWLALNSLPGAVKRFCWCLLERAKKFYAPWLAISFAVAAVLPTSGLWYSRKTERQFADVI